MNGLGPLLRAALRRDRWMLLCWLVGLVLLFWATAYSLPVTYTSQEALDRAAAALQGNPAYIALSGPTRALDTIGGQVAWQAQVFGAVVIGLMAMFLVVRHTRQEEESGRDEVLRSTPVGRLAPALAGIVISLGACLLSGLLVAASLVSTGLAVADSVAMGLGLSAVGWVFTASAWIAAQLGSTSRTAYGMAGAFIGIAYGLRAVGDVAEGGALGVLRWLSPIGWYSQLQAFSGLRWWPLGLSVVAAGVTLGLAGWLVGRRDYGSGLRADRPGPASGSLASGLALAVRLQRGPVIGWSIGMLVGGLTYGAIGDGVGDLIGDSETVNEIFVQGAQSIIDGFYGMALVMLALISSAFAITSAERPRREEEDGRADLLLATGLSRGRWLAGYVGVTVVGTTIVLACAGTGLGLGYGFATGDGAYGLRLAFGMMQYVPSVLVLSSVARLLHGVWPSRMVLGWLPMVFAFVVLFFGELFRMPQWLRDVSPFTHAALVPAEPFRAAPVLGVALAAVLLSVAGQFAFRRRDIG